ncbi:MAG: F0F1 ATP synthase subunit epsilon [Actinomycetia bacterium]|nr:F0F1 ATP synthase subunit epsilon [Actinomycetes bacterium]MCP5031870.1 F0F1 ATP synthase subunit epsilon [Actinomycetes bacterium]
MAYQVEFVSPEHLLYSDIAIQVIARTRGGGEIAFLTGHEPFIGSLMTCEVRVTEQSGDIKSFAVRGGFVSVSGTMSETKVTVLSDAAQPADEIDRSVVEAELAEAKATIAANPDDPYAADDLRWAEVRLEAIN